MNGMDFTTINALWNSSPVSKDRQGAGGGMGNKSFSQKIRFSATSHHTLKGAHGDSLSKTYVFMKADVNGRGGVCPHVWCSPHADGHVIGRNRLDEESKVPLATWAPEDGSNPRNGNGDGRGVGGRGEELIGENWGRNMELIIRVPMPW